MIINNENVVELVQLAETGQTSRGATLRPIVLHECVASCNRLYDTSSHGGRGVVAVDVFSSAWGGSFNIYRLVYFTAYCTKHRPSRLGYNLSTCVCM